VRLGALSVSAGTLTAAESLEVAGATALSGGTVAVQSGATLTALGALALGGSATLDLSGAAVAEAAVTWTAGTVRGGAAGVFDWRAGGVISGAARRAGRTRARWTLCWARALRCPRAPR
jgi:hypothetical protein